ncbi:MAG: prepilin-type N-terminal cleavage/methylation domain-containing protein [Lachnospiraceae bacterium]|nr:prepilin-type N-terminal cleavage/methylation domain-containing protein [Lachnospiraceae bacterium]
MKWGIIMKNNNKGYSLVEIIIVIAILAVVTSGAGISFRLIYNTRVTTGARNIQSMCKAARLNNMTKQKLKYIHLFRRDGTYYVYVDDQLTGATSNMDEQIGSVDMGISYGPRSGGTTLLANNKVFTIYFDRSGKCYFYDAAGNMLSSNITRILFSNGKRQATVNISKITGKVTME